MKTLTIYDIKNLTSETSPYFFSRQTLKFFNQTIKSFKVYKLKDLNKYHIIAPMQDRSGKVVGYTERYFNPVNSQLEHCK